MSHGIPELDKMSPNERLKIAEEYLDKYSKAKMVITTRLHAALPCLSMKTPVLMLNMATDQYRYSGLHELVRHATFEDFMNGKVDFDLDKPKPNPEDYLTVRKKLMKMMKVWASRIENKYKNCLKLNENENKKKNEI